MVNFADTVIYQSSVPLLHFYAEFLYQLRALPSLTCTEALAEHVNRPLFRLTGMIPTIDFRPPEIARKQ
jgi:hypothetical protein